MAGLRKKPVVRKPLLDVKILPKKIKKVKYDLYGADGVGMFLLEQTPILYKQFDIPKDIEEIIKEMKQKDFNNLVKVFKKYFDEFVEFDVK